MGCEICWIGGFMAGVGVAMAAVLIWRGDCKGEGTEKLKKRVAESPSSATKQVNLEGEKW